VRGRPGCRGGPSARAELALRTLARAELALRAVAIGADRRWSRVRGPSWRCTVAIDADRRDAACAADLDTAVAPCARAELAPIAMVDWTRWSPAREPSWR
jgi:hypothetical protein